MPEELPPKERPGFFHLLIPADLKDLPKARLLMGQVGRQAGLPESRVFDLQVAVSEATANAIEHAASGVEIDAWVLADRVIAEVTNDGVFQPGLCKDGDGRRRGLGLPLMVSLADQVHVSRRTEGKTRVSLTFFLEGYRSQASAPEEPARRELPSGDVESLYRNLVERSPDAILVHVGGRYVFVNPAAARLFGAHSPDDLIGLPAIERLHPDDRDLLIRRMSLALAGGVAPPVEGRMLRLDGTTIFVESTGSRVEFDGTLAIQAVIRDISERKLAEEEHQRLLAEGQLLIEELAAANEGLAASNEELAASGEELAVQTDELIERERSLRESEERLRSVLDSSLDGLYRVNLQTGRYDYLSPAYGPTIGHSNEVFAHLSPEDAISLVHPDDLPRVLAALGRGQATAAGEVEYRISGSDGEYRWISNHFSQSTDANGTLLYRYGVIRDITKRIQAEDALREGEERFRSVFTSNVAALAIWDTQGSLREANAKFLELIGYTPEQFAAGHVRWDEATPPELRQRDYDAVEELLAGRQIEPYEKEFLRPDGTRVPVIIGGSMLPGAPDQGVAFAIDITVRRQAQRALGESEERYRQLAAENERLYRQQLEIAENLQLALLDIPSDVGPVRLGHLYRLATEAARIGGDFYDVFEVKDGKIVVLIGDVSGHGIQAARTATLVKDVVHAFAHLSLHTDEVLRQTNALLVEKNLPGFVTAFLGILDEATGELRYSSAGHPDTLLRRTSGEVERLGSGTPPLGVFPEAIWRPHAVELKANDILLLYTDGVIEARRDGEFFGEKRLEEVLKSKGISPQRLPQLVLDEVLAFSEGSLHDDVAVLALSLSEIGAADTP